jgi:hypothetical protein
MDKDRFVSDRNIERYRRLACAAVTGPERTELLGLLADEEDKTIPRQEFRHWFAISPRLGLLTSKI